MRIKLTFSYDGSKFNGFQRLNELRSVQKELEEALSNIYGENIEVKGAGRTDAKVHAYGQVAHYDTQKKMDNLKNKINALVMPDIIIKSVKEVSNSFHARNSAVKKEYVYKINLGLYKSALNDYYFQPRYKLDIGLMRQTAKFFLGTHDFRNFVSGDRDNYVTTIFSIDLIKVFNRLEIRVVGTGFYRYMIRNIVGALLEVGKYKISNDVVRKMIENFDTPYSLPTAPPEGLYLNRIWYK